MKITKIFNLKKMYVKLYFNKLLKQFMIYVEVWIINKHLSNESNDKFRQN